MRRDDDKRQLKNYQCVRESGKLLCVLSGNLVVPRLELSCRIVKTIFHVIVEKTFAVIYMKIWPYIERKTLDNIP